MRILRNNLEWMAAAALRTVREEDKQHGDQFGSGHQQQLEAVLRAIESNEHITIE